MTKEKVLFAGCLITYRFPEYELSSKVVLEALHIETHILPELMCCGQVLQGVNPNWIYMTAYNLALVEQRDMDIITLCGGCTNTFKHVQSMCNQNPRVMDDINQVLTRVGVQFHNTVKTQHLLEVLNNQTDNIMACLKKVIPLKTAIMNPCQVFRPASVMNFDDSKHPKVMENLLGPVVSDIIPYSFQDNCCGASLSMSNLAEAYQVGRARLEELEDKDVDLIVTACGNCHLLLHCMQGEYYRGRRIPCLFIPQLLGLAMGFSTQDVMINDPHIRSMVTNV
ncbi:MAG: heterodisulfide reductase-related iron-sulfur binding cluster [Syntrophomonas sp.]|nr:heterodisulfide reductase-related iron-sulfur binding cluster [Syntrophomonas sp.]